MYSQNNEDSFLLKWFTQNGYMPSDIRFLDIGANDGKTLSNTFLFAENGASGVCVEADKRAYKKLKQEYAENNEIECYCAVLKEYTGKTDFFTMGAHLKKHDTGLLSTANRNELARWGKMVNFEKQERDCLTVQDFCTQYEVDLTSFNYLSIDIEGSDVEVLQQIPLQNILALVIECNGNIYMRDRILSYVEKQGLKMYHENAENLICVRR